MRFNTGPLLSAMQTAEIAESALIAAGVVVVLVGALRWFLVGRLGTVLDLPSPGPVRFEFVDFIAAVLIFMLLPTLVLSVQQRLGVTPATQPATRPAMQLSETITFVSVRTAAVAGLCIIGWRCYGRSLRQWGLTADRLGRDAWLAVAGYLAVWPACAGVLFGVRALIEWLAPGLDLPEHEAIKTLLREAGVNALSMLTVFGAVVLAPLAEELFFRGVFQSAVAQWTGSAWLGIGVSAGLFGAIHYPQVQNIPSLVLFAIVLGYAYARTGSLMLPILMHAVFNAKTLASLALSR